MDHSEVRKALPENVSKVLLAITSGNDLTKLEIKKRASLSMSTVLSSVEALLRRGLITMGERRVERGGKPHAVINVHPDRRTYGISYKSGVLTAQAVDLRGEKRYALFRDVLTEDSSRDAVLSVVRSLSEQTPPPEAIALALNADDREEIARSLEDAYGVPVLLTANTAAIGYLARWQGAISPFAVIGLGGTVKCAVFDRIIRSIDMSDLPCTPIISREGSFRSVLSSRKVEYALRENRYDDYCLADGGAIREIRTQGEYARALALTIGSLCRMTEKMLAPREILLFGDYLSEGFFERIRSLAPLGVPLRLVRAEREDFARGAAICALIERVFS